MFISFEGIDGSGKTTQSKRCVAHLRELGYNVMYTREPGGTKIGDQIRTILLDDMNNTDMHPRTELLLFCASRAQLVGEIIRPFLEKGGIVICDRYADSTLAYQGYGHGLDVTALKQVLDFATGRRYPDMTIYLELDPETGLKRRRAGTFQGEDWNRLDDMELDFHRRVYDGYEKIIATDPSRFVRVNANRSFEAIEADVKKNIKARLPEPVHGTD